MKRIIKLCISLLFITWALEASLKTISIEIKGTGYTVGEITNGQKLFLNRTYVLLASEVSADAATISAWVLAQGWEKQSSYFMNYNDGLKTELNLFRKTCFKDLSVANIQPEIFSGAKICSSIIQNDLPYLLPPPGVIIHNSLTTTNKYVGSPSIVIMPDGSYVASHDYFGNFVSDSYIYKSIDRGKTWIRLAELKNQEWSTLFNRGDELYLIGISSNGSSGYGHCVIRKSLDGGKTWTNPSDGNSGLLKSGYYHCAPVPVVKHKGKIWRAFENMGKSGGWGPFSALMTSAPENADLLKASNWTFTNEILYQSSFRSGTSAWLEGNAVVGPNGGIKNVLRVAYSPDNLGAICSVSDDGTTISFNPQTDFINLPGACKKFTIRYDEISKSYWSLVNYVLASDRVTGDNGAIRNTQVLIHSTDLRNWTIKDTILHVDEKNFHGFQYVDWQFDGEDIVAVSRTAWEDAGGLPPRQHDANYLTFHRIPKFRFDKPAVVGKIEVLK